MPITQEQIALAQSYQHTAAHDENQKVRLVAGPGTGKSYAIGERVRWLLSNGIAPESIYVVSFTNAASSKLKEMISIYCEENDQTGYERVSVSTLHSLGLKSLRLAGQLLFPVEPLVLDDFEVEEILEKEFSTVYGYTPGRCRKIREDYEAFSSTGTYEPVSYIPPDPPITELEREHYTTFHTPRTILYSCVLPGEIVRQCVDRMYSGTLNPIELLGIEHFIVDEYQDFNPADIEFINWIVEREVITFVAGDDDQSIYSFRHATPEGIQEFIAEDEPGNHELPFCFRCTTDVLRTAQNLIRSYSQPTRIQKGLTSLYSDSNPSNSGVTQLWNFPSAVSEARQIAQSCSDLIDSGIDPKDIMVLLSYTDLQMRNLKPEFENQNIPFISPKQNLFVDTKYGRFVLSILRIICNPDDYIAYRLLLGLLPGVGPVTCNNIAQNVMGTAIRYKDIFENEDRINTVFSGRELTAVLRVREILISTSEWTENTEFKEINQRIDQIIEDIFDGQDGQDEETWEEVTSIFPDEMNLKEIRDYLWKSDIEEKSTLIKEVYERIDKEVPEEDLTEDSVSILTMHGAKGLDAKVVFIPGLEEQLFPGPKRREYPGLILEAARMLYVSITRAKAACIMSYSNTRIIHGAFTNQTPSRFINSLGLGSTFQDAANGLNQTALDQINRSIAHL